jgi:cation transport ATPase
VAAAALLAVLGGLVLAAFNHHRPADWLWAATTAMLLVPLTWSVFRSLLRRDVGVDAIALFSMAGALALGEYLAGAVVALMLAGGNALEEAANRRARRELTALVERAPRTALVRRDDESSRCRSTRWRSTRSCSSGPARSSPSPAWSRARRRSSTSPR